MIAVTGLTKTFGATRAVDDVSFEVHPGEVVGFLGRNGAGKTTTMRVLTGYFPPTAGRVVVASHDVFEEPLAVKRRVGYLPETPPLYTEMVVSTYLRFCARLKGVAAPLVGERLDAVVDRCGLREVRGRVVGNLSRGYRQRVALAQALIHDPDVLVLDEPTTALDPGQIHEIRSLIRELAGAPAPGPAAGAAPPAPARESGADGEDAGADEATGAERAALPRGRTVILSTHRLEDVTATCSRVLVISRGRLVADEPLEAVTKKKTLEERFLELTADPDPARAREAGR